MSSVNQRRRYVEESDPIADLERIMGRAPASRETDPFANLFDDARRPAAQPRFDDGDLYEDFEPADPEAYLAPQTDDPRYAEPPPSDYDDFVADNMEPDFVDADPARTTAPAPALQEGRSGLSNALLAACVVGLIVFGGGAYAYLSGMFSGSGSKTQAAVTPAIVKAPAEPAKIAPPPEQKTTEPNVKPLESATTTGKEVIVSREEQPVDLAVTPAPEAVAPAPVATPVVAAPVKAPAAGTDTDAVGAKPVAVGPTPAAPGEPRRVKTVKVLADGTIVTGDGPAVAGDGPVASSSAQLRDSAAVQPVVAPVSEAPAAPVRVVTTAKPVATEPVAAEPVAAQPPPLKVASVEPVKVPAPPEKPVAVATSTRSIDAVLAEAPPTAKVADQLPKAAAPKAVEPAAAKPKPQAEKLASAEPVPAKPKSAPVAKGGFVVQIASQKSQADAQATLKSLQRKLSGAIGNNGLSIRRADLGEKGVFFRVRVGPFASRDAATATCLKIKGAGGDCVVSAN